MSVNKKLTAVLVALTVVAFSASVCAEQVDVQEQVIYQDLGTGADLRIAGANQPSGSHSPAQAGSSSFYKGKHIANDEGDDSTGSEGETDNGNKKQVPINTGSNGSK